MNDGKKSYEVGKDGQGQESGSCSVRRARFQPRRGRIADATCGCAQLDFRRTDVTAKARITYFKGHFTEVAIHHDKWDEWTTCFTIPGLELPSNPFLGFTAHTGDVHGQCSFHWASVGGEPEPESSQTPTISSVSPHQVRSPRLMCPENTS